jgi:hypothetical protein
MRNYYVPGSWNVICDRCGLKHKSHQLKKEWTGLMVCCDCYETRHPQDLLRVTRDEQSTPWSRPESTDTFVYVGDGILTESELYISAESGAFLLTET